MVDTKMTIKELNDPAGTARRMEQDPSGAVDTMLKLDAATEKVVKKLFAKTKQNYELHVALIMRSEDVTKAHATIIAYGEGEAGLTRRLDGR